MPLFHTITHQNNSCIYIWKITETLTDLQSQVQLTEASYLRMSKMKSQAHQRGFLAVRSLLKEANTNDQSLYYDPFGKPHLRDGRHISISHSHEFAAIAVSNQIIGLDLELTRDKISKIAPKFMAQDIYAHIQNKKEYIKCLTVDWGIKEAIFKIRNEPGISFKNHIYIEPYQLRERKTVAYLQMPDVQACFNAYFMEIENYVLVYAMAYNP